MVTVLLVGSHEWVSGIFAGPASDEARRATSGTAIALIVVGVAAFVVIAIFLALLRSRPRSASPPTPPRDIRTPALMWFVAALVGGAILFETGVSRATRDAVPAPDAMEFLLTIDDNGIALRYPNGLVETRDPVLPSGSDLAVALRSEGARRRLVSPDLGVDVELADGDEVTVPVRISAGDRITLFDGTGAPQTIKLVPRAEFDAMLANGPSNPYCPVAGACTEELASRWGKEIFEGNACVGCHSRDGSRLVGPSFRGLFGRHEMLAGGGGVVVDASYIAESIRVPTAKVVKGYTPVMPPFRFNDQQVDAVVAYARTLEDPSR